MTNRSVATLHVCEIFDSVQGEGYWAGVPMTFVRLAGCNASELGLCCLQWCDTPESWDFAAGEEQHPNDVIRRVSLPRICLTGGEPLLQPDGVAGLTAVAHRHGIRVHLETNGTVDPRPILSCASVMDVRGGDDAGFDWTAISPKPPDYRIAEGWDGLVDELKLVADDHLDAAAAEQVAARHPGAIVCIQPRHGGETTPGVGRVAAERALALVMSHPEWRLSLQIHKLLDIR